MKLGFLADIHEDVEKLRVALRRFDLERVDQVIVLGDVAEMNQRLDETCRLLLDAGAVGVWGNHDFGICQVSAKAEKYPEAVREFMPTLRPRLEMNGCHFSHVEPWRDPTDVAQLWHFDGVPTSIRKARRSFAAVSSRLLFVGHFHRWLAVTPNAFVPWQGSEPLRLDRQKRYLVGIAAVCDGASAILDLSEWTLWPFRDR